MTLTDEQLDLWGKKILERCRDSDDERENNWVNHLQGLAERTDDSLDAVVAVSGKRGLGKSSYAILSAVIMRQFGLEFDFSDIYYGERSLITAVNKIATTRKRVYVFDEIIDLAYSRNAMTTLNKNLARFFTKVRKMNNIIFLCIPRFKNLDPAIRNDVVHFWTEVFWRGETSLHRKSGNPASSDPWGLDDKKVIYRKAYTQRDHEKLMRKFPSFLWFMKFPPLPVALENAYLEGSEHYLGEAGAIFMESLQPKRPKGRPKKEPEPEQD